MKSLLKFDLDRLGICTSAICALHCLITPFIIVALPFAGVAFLKKDGLELGILLFSFFVAIASLVVSYFQKHHNTTPMILAGLGFSSFLIGKAVPIEMMEILLSILGGLCVIIAHYKNGKLTREVSSELKQTSQG